MAEETIVIYNFQVLESAISSFTSSSNTISGLATNLSSVAPSVDAAIKSTAGETFAGHVKTLSKSVSDASAKLNKEINDLKGYVERARAANASATNVANSVQVFNME